MTLKIKEAIIGGALLALGGILISVPLTPLAKGAGATLSVTVTKTINLSVLSPTVAFPSLTPGTAVDAYSTSTVLTNDSNGFAFSFNRNNGAASTTLTTSTYSIPEPTAWIPGANTSTGGTAALYTPASGLAFRVPLAGTTGCAQSTQWWGTNDTGAAKYAGTTSTISQIANCGTYQPTSSTVVINYHLDVSSTQQSGDYTGAVTYSATVNP